MTRKDGSKMSLAASKKASELDRNQEAWEEAQLLRSGVAVRKQV